MATNSALAEELDRFGRRGVYSLVMGLGAFFAYFNERFGWISVPEYDRWSDPWLKPLLALAEPYLGVLVIAIGAGFLCHAIYCYSRYSAVAKSGRSAA
ncbi:hypothetical protein GCM10027188_29380 [Lysobacter humi (ex Lee et al. 2017)]